jgi:hypothetical protein
MQDGKFKEAIRYYEPIVKKQLESLLAVPAIVLANLCVSYIMTSQNEEAEELMRRVEKEEERAGFAAPDKQSFHLCIINLVIGTLYCAKGNFEFGIGRVMKSLEPYKTKLGLDTWFYTKRCFLALAETLAKHMIMSAQRSAAHHSAPQRTTAQHSTQAHTRHTDTRPPRRAQACVAAAAGLTAAPAPAYPARARTSLARSASARRVAPL